MARHADGRIRVFIMLHPVWRSMSGLHPRKLGEITGYVAQLISRGTNVDMYKSVKRPTELEAKELALRYLESARGANLVLTIMGGEEISVADFRKRFC